MLALLLCSTGCGTAASGTGTERDASEVTDAPIDASLPSDGALCEARVGEACCAGSRCGGTAICASGTCSPSADVTLLATNQSRPSDLIVTGGAVYFLNATGSNVSKVPVEGGATTVVVSGASGPRRITSDGTNIYWSESNGTIRKVPVSGGSASTVTSATFPEALTVDSANVYFIDGSVLKYASVNGGTAQPIYNANQTVHDLTSDGTKVFITTSHDNVVMAIWPNNGSSSIVSSNAATGSAWSLALDSGVLFFTTANGHGVWSVPATGGTATEIVTSTGFTEDIAADATHVYWTETSPGRLLRATRTGANVTTLISNLQNPVALALDATSVYCADKSAGLILKIPK